MIMGGKIPRGVLSAMGPDGAPLRQCDRPGEQRSTRVPGSRADCLWTPPGQSALLWAQRRV